MNPRVSVLLPCRDAAGTVGEAVASLTAQTWRDLEVVAVDDGSSDGTAAALAALAAADARIRVLDAAGRGIAAALNQAAAAARGALLARMDADDVAHRDRIARQVAWLDTHPDVTACGTGVRYFPRRLVRAGGRRYEAWLNAITTPDDVARDLFVECPIAHPTLMVRREAFNAVGGYADGRGPEDYDLVLRLAVRGAVLANVPAVLHDWRERPDRLSRTDSRYAPAEFRALKVRFLDQLRLKGRPAVVWGAGPVGKAFARALQTQGIAVRAFVDLDPRKVGQVMHGAPVIAPAGVADHANAYVLAAVGQDGAREEIRAALRALGRTEVEEFCAVA